MTKQRLTKKQAIAKRQSQLREQAALDKLLKQRSKTNNREISVNAIPTYAYDDPVGAKDLPSAPQAPEVLRSKVVYEKGSELAKREAAAEIERDKKRKRLAPLYSKGPVQYITDDADPKELGRKL
jgi:hypothetical protein